MLALPSQARLGRFSAREHPPRGWAWPVAWLAATSGVVGCSVMTCKMRGAVNLLSQVCLVVCGMLVNVLCAVRRRQAHLKALADRLCVVVGPPAGLSTLEQPALEDLLGAVEEQHHGAVIAHLGLGWVVVEGTSCEGVCSVLCCILAFWCVVLCCVQLGCEVHSSACPCGGYLPCFTMLMLRCFHTAP